MNVNRPKAKHPDAKTAEGQCALYLAHLLERHHKSAEDLAKGIGKSRAMVFRYLNGETPLTIAALEQVAKYLHLESWRDALPTAKFLRELAK
jgi:transcriptional regulator with XRE-family HTH domain